MCDIYSYIYVFFTYEGLQKNAGGVDPLGSRASLGGDVTIHLHCIPSIKTKSAPSLPREMLLFWSAGFCSEIVVLLTRHKLFSQEVASRLSKTLI